MTDLTSDAPEPQPVHPAWSSAPVVLGPNQPLDRPYLGGAGIARFRGTPHADAHTPEDFVGSTTEVHAGCGVGFTTLPDGPVLRDAIHLDPIGFLGEEHVAAFGADTMLLLKLLHTGERLFVHFHPDDAFALAHGLAAHGKTEAWIVIDVEDGVEGFAHLGFERPVAEVEAEQWFRQQDVPDMLGAMHRVPLSAGDTLVVPAGVPHAIGAGITLVELQQPTDLSILLEYEGFHGLTETDALLGLDLRTAMSSLDRAALDEETLRQLGHSRPVTDSGSQPLFPTSADTFFRADRIHVSGTHVLPPGYSIVVVVDGAGSIEWDAGSLPLRAGMTLLVPHGAGPVTLGGAMTVLRGRPPGKDAERR